MIELETLSNQKIKNAKSWMNANMLTINAAKTRAMFFSNINNFNIINFSLSCNGCPITIQNIFNVLIIYLTQIKIKIGKDSPNPKNFSEFGQFRPSSTKLLQWQSSNNERERVAEI